MILNAFTARINPVKWDHRERGRVVRSVAQPPEFRRGKGVVPAGPSLAEKQAIIALHASRDDLVCHLRSKGITNPVPGLPPLKSTKMPKAA